MARCHDCDRILREEPYWREARGSRREIPLCARCVDRWDDRAERARRGRVLLIVFLCLLPILIPVLLWCIGVGVLLFHVL